MKEGRSVSSGFLRAKYLVRPSGGARFAFVVGKKVAGDAVTRNRLRRWASVAARGAHGAPHADVAVMIQKKYSSSKDLAGDLAALIGKIV